MDWEKYRREVLLIGGGMVAVFGGVVWNQVPSRTEEVRVLSASSESQNTGNSEEQIFVDVGGGVKKPGVYGFSYGKRIGDAIDTAGGLSVEADVDWVEKNLNKSEKVKDGSKIYIPLKNKEQETNFETQTSSTSQISNSKVNINEVGSGALDTLPGVGEVTAQKIIDGRPYARVEELLERKIVTKRVFEQIQERVSVY